MPTTVAELAASARDQLLLRLTHPTPGAGGEVIG